MLTWPWSSDVAELAHHLVIGLAKLVFALVLGGACRVVPVIRFGEGFLVGGTVCPHNHRDVFRPHMSHRRMALFEPFGVRQFGGRVGLGIDDRAGQRSS
jgi:hypothetical protein